MLSASRVQLTSLAKHSQQLTVSAICRRKCSTAPTPRAATCRNLHRLTTSRSSSHNLLTCRAYSTNVVASSSIHPISLALTEHLAEKQPGFSLPAESISILNDPVEFYQRLLEMIYRAKERIFISSLYIGSKEKELISALHTALSSNPSLQLYLTLDFNRSTRPGSSPSSSTAHLLLPVLQQFPDRVHVSMFRSPHLRGWLAKLVPPRFNEGWGTWHAKVYGADGEVMISGANLNESYFTNRQDRYIHFASQPTLAQYCLDFLQTVSAFSYRLLPPAPSFATTFEPNIYTIRRDDYTLHWPDPSTHPHHIQKKAETALAGFQSKQRDVHSIAVDTTTNSPPNSKEKKNKDEVLLFPIIQAGQFNIREEESAFSAIFSSSASSPSLSSPSPKPLIDLTSGYFSLYQPYQSHVLCSPADTRIVVAAPEANGFYGSKGISGRIPEGYVLKERRFVEVVRRMGRWWGEEKAPEEDSQTSVSGREGGRVKLEEWRKDGWTYHAKGIWVSPGSPSSSSRNGRLGGRPEPPVATLFGSTNLNARSAHIDTELSFVMVLPVHASGASSGVVAASAQETPVSPVESLRLKLGEELERIREHASEWKGDKRPVRFLTKIIVWLVKGML